MSSRLLSSLMLAAGLSLVGVGPAYADELVVESEQVPLYAMLPALEGTELGALVVADAPLPGESRVLRASDIRAVLKANGRDARGLALPKSVRLVRRARSVSSNELSQRVREAVGVQIAPCTVESVSNLPPVTLGGGDYDVEVDASARRNSGRTSLVLTLRQGERSQRISAQLELSCPAPVIQPGASVRAVFSLGMVRVSTTATAHQAGRVGDEIRVTNQSTKKQLRARVIDAQTVEVLP
jgi:hypothetical protein